MPRPPSCEACTFHWASGATYVAGSFLHHYQGSPPPMPERAIIGPPWWIDLVCDIADAVDR